MFYGTSHTDPMQACAEKAVNNRDPKLSCQIVRLHAMPCWQPMHLPGDWSHAVVQCAVVVLGFLCFQSLTFPHVLTQQEASAFDWFWSIHYNVWLLLDPQPICHKNVATIIHKLIQINICP